MRSSLVIFCFTLICSGTLLAQQRLHPPLLVTLDHNNDFVITGIGQPVSSLNFAGPGDFLEDPPGTPFFRDPETGEFKSSAPAPFSVLVESKFDDDDVVFSAPIGTTVEISGSYPLLFGPRDISRLDELDIQILYGGATPLDNPFGFACESCVYPDATITPEGGIEVTNINEPIVRVSVFANEGGLLQLTEVPAGATITKSTATRLVLENPDGFDPADLATLGFSTGASSSGEAFIKFDLSTGSSFGPMPVASAAIPEPNGALLVLVATLGCFPIRKRRRRISAQI